MKKILLFLVFLIPSFVYAKEINLCERTYEDLKIDESIDINTVDAYEVLNTPCVDDTQKVYDFADLLDDTQEDNLYKFINSYIEAYKSDFIIVTINKNDNCIYDNINDCTGKYANDFYKYNNFKKDGVIILVDLENKNDILNIYSNGNTSSIFNLKTIKSIKDYSYKYFNINEYYEGFKDIIYTMSSYYTKDLSFYNETKVTTVKDTNKYFIFFIISFLISFVLGILFMSFNYNKSKSKRVIVNDSLYVKNNGVNKVNDILINEFEVVSDSDLFDDYNIKGDIV